MTRYRKQLYAAALGFCTVFLSFAFTQLRHWNITEEVKIAFTNEDVTGTFKTVKGSITFDEQQPASAAFSIVIDAASINTGNILKNRNARGEDFLETDTYPEIRFRSSAVSRTSTGWQIKGILELHGVKREISFPFTFSRNGNRGRFEGNFRILLSDYNIWNPDEIDNNLQINVSVPVNGG